MGEKYSKSFFFRPRQEKFFILRSAIVQNNYIKWN